MRLRFEPQGQPSEINVVIETEGRPRFNAYFRCRTGQALRPNPDALFCLGIYPASEIGATLVIDGAVDDELLDRAGQIGGLFHSWWPDCQIAEVRASRGKPPARPRAQGAALFFSGGVDSSYSLLAERQNLSAIVTVLGVDAPLSDNAATARLEAMCHEVAAAKDVEPIVIETNVRQAIHPIAGWIEYHGGALAAIGHMLSDRVDRLLIASSGNEATWTSPWGSHPALDPLLSSSKLRVEHHGLVSRFDKIEKISNDPVVMEHLRVCNRARQNCGHCDKCAFVMRSLKVLGFDSAATFPPFTPRKGHLKIVDDAFLTEVGRLEQAASDAGHDDIAQEARATIAAYRSGSTILKSLRQRWRSWARVTRHRRRWFKVAAR